MHRLVIDVESLIMALEHHEPESYQYLDRETGEVAFLSLSSFADTDEETRQKIEADPERYIPIEPLPSSVGWQVMDDFIASLPSSDVKERLATAIQRSRPFRGFKDVLLDYPPIREAWFRYHQDACTQLAQEWLKDQGINAELRKVLPGNEA